MEKANQDIRQYMADHCVTQRDLAAEVGISQTSINKSLAKELCQYDKEVYLNLIDAIASRKRNTVATEVCEEESTPADEEESEDVSRSTKFQIGDRVKIPAKENTIGIVSDIWSSLAKATFMYAVANESDGHIGLYAEGQLEPAPVPITYSFDAHIDVNVAVVTMNATQGDKTWVYARGHAHIIHDGEVGMAQAISYASRRMFETLDKAQDKQIYFKGGN